MKTRLITFSLVISYATTTFAWCLFLVYGAAWIIRTSTYPTAELGGNLTADSGPAVAPIQAKGP